LDRGGGGLGLLRGVVRRSPSASLVEVEIRKGLEVDRVESGRLVEVDALEDEESLMREHAAWALAWAVGR
jgi:hypothetical protein